VWRESTRTNNTTRNYGQSQSWRDVTEQASIALTDGQSQTLRPRLTIEDLLNLFSTRGQFLLHVYHNTGFSHFNGLPIAVRGVHCTDEQTYKRRKAAVVWPTLDDSGVMLNPATKFQEPISRADMQHTIKDFFGIEATS